jgi:hypothetical protein
LAPRHAPLVETFRRVPVVPAFILPHRLDERLALPRKLGLPLPRRIVDQVVNRVPHRADARLVRVEEGERARVGTRMEGGGIDVQVPGRVNGIIWSAACDRHIVRRLQSKKEVSLSQGSA